MSYGGLKDQTIELVKTNLESEDIQNPQSSPNFH